MWLPSCVPNRSKCGRWHVIRMVNVPRMKLTREKTITSDASMHKYVNPQSSCDHKKEQVSAWQGKYKNKRVTYASSVAMLWTKFINLWTSFLSGLWTWKNLWTFENFVHLPSFAFYTIRKWYVSNALKLEVSISLRDLWPPFHHLFTIF